MEENTDDLLDQWLTFNDSDGELEIVTGNTIPKAVASDYYPLSFAQQRLWFVYQKNPASAVYNYSEIWHFKSDSFHQESFILALEKVVAKHMILASNYVNHAEEPALVFRSRKSYSLHHFEKESAEKVAENRLKELASQPFRLESDPLIRLGILPHDHDTYLVGVTFHHIIIDAWSMGIIRQDFAQFYNSIRQKNTGLDDVPDPIELQYSDYTTWQASLKNEPLSEDSLSQANPSFTELPLDYPRPANPSFEGKLTRFSLPESLNQKISDLVKSSQTTEFNLFLACFHILIGKYAHTEQVNVGIPVLNRGEEELKSMVGYFVDTQVIKGSLDEKMSFFEFLKTIKTEVLQAISSQKPSYESQQSTSLAVKDQSYNPLFQVMFVGHSSGENPFKTLGLAVDFEVLDLDVSKFDLTLHQFGLKDGAYQFGLEFSKDLFSKAFSDRFKRHFTALIKQICVNPTDSIGSFTLLDEEEKHFLSAGLCHGFESELAGTVLTEIYKSLKTQKDQVAVVCGDERLTYGELDQRSKLIAQELMNNSVDPNFPIGIYLERSVDYLVAILAILRYGAAYLPLDPDYPEQRIVQYLEESKASLILTDKRLSKLSQTVKGIVNLIEIDSLDYTQASINQFDRIPNPLQAAYLIFTSGSSSKPKGVVVSHANLYSSMSARVKYYSSAPTSFLMLSSFSFDSSVAGIFWSLFTGAKLVITQSSETLDTSALARIIPREEVSHSLLLPSLYKALLQNEAKPWVSLKGIILAGEEFPNQLIKAHFDRNPQAQLFNEYGPTEGTVWCTVQELKAENNYHRVPIGLATANTMAYVVDEKLALSPTGIAGELCIAGPAVVAGYISQDEKESKFVKNPYSEEWNTVYRTGDLVRIQENGLLEYLGRIDNQVKIRGHRVELNEIQELANKLASVSEAVALVTDGDNPRIILAFISNQPTAEEELSQHLLGNLPKYMVPEQFLRMSEFPLLPNGKVDLKKLKAIAMSKATLTSREFKAPSTYLERQIAGIWADVMGLEEVPVNRDFNELGGNSLQSIRIIARCRDIGIKVTPPQFLRYSTVESLVKSLNHESYSRPENTLELDILKIWESNLGQKLIGVKDSFHKNGGSDYEWKRVEEELNHTYNFSSNVQVTDTIQELAKKIVNSKNGSEASSQPIRRIIPIKTTGSKSPLFCIHSEFYYETVYSQLTRHIPNEYPVYGLLSVSPDLVKEVVPQNIEEIATLCLDEIRIVQSSGPYRILSYSIGNVVAFELAKQLQEKGENVKLIMIDPPLFFDKSRTFGKGGYMKIFTYLDYLKKPSILINKALKKVKKDRNQPALIQDTGLLKKYILAYKPQKLHCDTLLITTPREFKYTFGWEPLVTIVDREEILGPHLKLMREPYTGQLNEAIARNLKKWDDE